MEQQEALTPGPGGIWSRFWASGAINAAPWMDALSRGQLVGSCRCGGYLRPGRPYRVGLVDWYPTTCTAGCGREPAAHGPRPKPKPPPRKAGHE